MAEVPFRVPGSGGAQTHFRNQNHRGANPNPQLKVEAFPKRKEKKSIPLLGNE